VLAVIGKEMPTVRVKHPFKSVEHKESILISDQKLRLTKGVKHQNMILKRRKVFYISVKYVANQSLEKKI